MKVIYEETNSSTSTTAGDVNTPTVTNETNSGRSEQPAVITDLQQRQNTTDENLKSIEERMSTLNKEAERIQNDFLSLEKKNAQFVQLVSAIIIVVLISFVIEMHSIGKDYTYNNEQRYEKFIDRTEEIKDNYYSKQDIDKMFDQFKSCVWNNGLTNCLK